jgi:succinylglutamic semialdehyde dehydrogenase
MRSFKKIVRSARAAFEKWGVTSLEDRTYALERYAAALEKHQASLAELISQETGKPLWESKSEVSSMIQKIPISIQAYRERCPDKKLPMGDQKLITFYKPHGVVAVLGPFNFPGHLPNGHFVPALLAGNTVIFKPSEITPAVGEKIAECFRESGLPEGVFQVVQGGPEMGKKLMGEPGIDGFFFTGSASTGILLNKQLAKHPGKILALEMGGNNPLVISHLSDIPSAVYATIQSAYLTSGQRCSCARRLILIATPTQEPFLKAFIQTIKTLRIGPYTDRPEPFMGPVIHMKAAEKLLQAQEKLIQMGAKPICEMRLIEKNRPFLTPGLIDVTSVPSPPDEEYFGPLLQVIHVSDFEAALAAANRTSFGLTAGLFSTVEKEWEQFLRRVRAGVINWNAPLTGASSQAPFGGIGKSGNHRPSAYLAADYCSYPIASVQTNVLQLPITRLPGISL